MDMFTPGKRPKGFATRLALGAVRLNQEVPL